MNDEQQPQPTPLSPPTAPATASRVSAFASAGPEDETLKLRASGLVLVAVLALTIAFLYPSDWGASEFITLVLLGLSFALTCAVVFQVAQLLVDEPAAEVVSAIFGQRLSVRNKSRFLRRVQHECTDAQLRTHNRVFSLLVLRFPAELWSPEFNEPLPNIIDVVRARIRGRDVLGDLGAGELWVLALGAGANAAESVTARIADGVARDLPQLPGAVRFGWSTFQVDARDVKQLIAVARSRAGYGDIDDEVSEAA